MDELDQDCAFLQQISKILEWQQKQEQQVKLAEEFSYNFKEKLEKNKFNLNENNLDGSNLFENQILFDITEESFENGLPLNENKFSEKKFEISENNLNKKFKQNEISTNYEHQNHSSAINNKIFNFYIENNNEELNNDLNLSKIDKFKEYSNENESFNIKNNSQFEIENENLDHNYSNLTNEKILNSYEFDEDLISNYSISKFMIKDKIKQDQLFNKKLIDKNLDNIPIKPGINGTNVKSFNDLLANNLHNTDLCTNNITNQNKKNNNRPFLRKRTGLKRYQNFLNDENKQPLKLDSSPKLKKNNLSIKERKLRLEYLSQPKNKNFCRKFDSIKTNEIQTNKKCQINQNKNCSNECLYELNEKMTNCINEIESINKFYQKNDVNQNKIFKKSEPNFNIKSSHHLMPPKHVNNKIEMVSNLQSANQNIKLSKNVQSKNNFVIDESRSKNEASNDTKLEVLLETFIDLIKTDNCNKKFDSLKQLLKENLNEKLNEKIFQKVNCDKYDLNDKIINEYKANANLEYDELSNLSRNENDIHDNLLNVPRIGMQTLSLQNRIEFIQKRLNNLQNYCDQAESYISKNSNLENHFLNNQNLINKTNSNKYTCQCNNQIDDLKCKLDSISIQLKNLNLGIKCTDKEINLTKDISQSKLSTNFSSQINKNKQIKELDLCEIKNLVPKSKINGESKLKKDFSRIPKQKIDLKSKSSTILANKALNNNENLKTANNANNERDNFKVVEYKNGLKVIEKNNGHLEKIYPNGNHEIFFIDGTIIRTLSDGTKIVDFTNGEREICTKFYKRREFADGKIKTIYADETKETRYSNGRIKIKDKFGNIIVDSRILTKIK